MLLNFDVAGAEWLCVAYLCRDEAMLEVARQKKSPHTITAMRMSGLPEEIIVRENKLIGDTTNALDIAAIRRDKIPEVLSAKFLPRTMSLRQAGKKAGHSLDYGEGYKTFALLNEMDEREAKTIYDLYHQAYPGIQRWHAAIREQIDKNRTLTNTFGRKIYLLGQLSNDTYKQAYAAIPQSTVVDITNRALGLFMRDASPDFAPAQLLAQVHDSIVADYLSQDFAAMARFAIKLGLDYMRPWLDYGEPFRLDVDLKVGMDWGTMIAVKLTEDADALAEELRKAWEELQGKRRAKAV